MKARPGKTGLQARGFTLIEIRFCRDSRQPRAGIAEDHGCPGEAHVVTAKPDIATIRQAPKLYRLGPCAIFRRPAGLACAGGQAHPEQIVHPKKMPHTRTNGYTAIASTSLISGGSAAGGSAPASAASA